MTKYFTKILEERKERLVGDVDIRGKIYSWGSGFIEFTDTGIKTKWGSGGYDSLGENWYKVYWSNHYHVIRLNADLTEYQGLRIHPNDFSICSGKTLPLIDELLTRGVTLVSRERLLNLEKQCSLFTGTNYSFVECGVAKGGCLALMKAVAGKNNRIFGFDSFEGMPDITDKDLGSYNKSDPLSGFGKVGDNLSGGIENVYKTFENLNLNMTNITLVKGFFNDTLKDDIINSIGPIAVLRLDGDRYESTRVCLEKLYEKVIVGGVILIDDYGYFIGAKRATDEFRENNNITSPLIQTDYTEYYWIKTNNTFEDRQSMLQHYCKTIPNPKILEIGIFKGEFLDYLVQGCGASSIDGVDLFEGINFSGDVDGNNLISYDIGKSYIDLTEKYKNNPAVRLYKSDSSRFLASVADNTYDIIYIDGDHSYGGSKKDLEQSYKKIKNGGYIMGHDYEMNMKKAKTAYNFGVKQAVDEFCEKYNQILLAKAMDGCVSFCIRIQK